MRKQEAGKNAKDRIIRVRPNTKGVIITVYVESPIKRLHRNKNPLPKRQTEGYNRRAEMLAFSRELRRNGSPQQTWQPKRTSKPKFKMWKWSSISARIQSSFRRIFRRKQRQFMYERIPSENYSEIEGEFSRRKKRAPRKHISASSYCRKLKHLFKELSSGLQCKKGCR